MAIHKDLEEAKMKIDQALKDGLITSEELEDLSDEEYIKLANNLNIYDR